VTSISLYINSYTATCNVKVGIYANDGSGGAAGTLKGQTGSYTVAATGWHTWSGLNIALSAGTYYFYWVSSNSMTTMYSGGGNGEYVTKTTFANELLAKCQAMTSDPGCGGQSVYATYTPSVQNGLTMFTFASGAFVTITAVNAVSWLFVVMRNLVRKSRNWR